MPCSTRATTCTIIVDNGYSAATGGQDILSSQAAIRSAPRSNSIETAVRGIGVKWARTLTHTYDVQKMTATPARGADDTEKGPKVIVAQSECMLNKQRRVKPLVNKAMKDGKRVVRERFGVDADTCTGDHSCIRLSGCPSLTIKPNPDPLRKDPVATVIDSCVGCGAVRRGQPRRGALPLVLQGARSSTTRRRWDIRKDRIRRRCSAGSSAASTQRRPWREHEAP